MPAALLLLLLPAASYAQPAAPSQASALEEALARPDDLVLRDTSLPSALLTIGQEWEVNIVFGQEVEGIVNCAFYDTPLREILDSILMANGYGYRPVGRSLVIVPLEDLGDFRPMFTSATITLETVNPSDVASSASLMSSPMGKVQAIPTSRALLVIDYPDRVDMIRRFVEQLDAAAGGGVTEGGPLAVEYFCPQFVEAVDLLESVSAVLSVNGRVTVVDSENRLVVVDCPPCLELARQVVERIDTPRPQVRISALIYDISLEDMERIGINWGSALKNVNSDGVTTFEWAIDSMLSIPAGPSTPAATMSLANMTQNFDLTAVLDFLRTCNDSRLLADPTVMVVDREPATIQIVTEIPIQQLTETSQGGNLSSTGFRDAGVTLTVVPHIAFDRTILMDVTPVFSRLAGFTTGDTPQPIIDKREASTTVRVADGHTFVIGGLRQRQEVGDFRRVVGLGDIQIADFGALFRFRERKVRESELVVFIRPQIIDIEYPGTTREQMAGYSTESLLSRVPAATDDPCAFGCQACTPHGPYPISEPNDPDQLYLGLPYRDGYQVPEVIYEDVPAGPSHRREEMPTPDDGAYRYPYTGPMVVPEGAGYPQVARSLERMPGTSAPPDAAPPSATPTIDSMLRPTTAEQVAAAPAAVPVAPSEPQPRREVASETWLRQVIEFR